MVKDSLAALALFSVKLVHLLPSWVDCPPSCGAQVFLLLRVLDKMIHADLHSANSGLNAIWNLNLHG